MNMTASYLIAKKEEVKSPKIGKDYRVIGFYINGSIFNIEKIENGFCHFKGYVTPRSMDKLKFYEVE